jgi:small subunit ribosomal protein S6
MRPYEVVIILDTALEDDVIQGAIGRATQLLTERGATVNNTDRWGKRRFAYELHHRWEGYYVLLEVSAEPAAIAELDRLLSLADEVVRHKVIRLPKEALRSSSRRRRPEPEATEAGPASDAIGA